MEIPLGSSWETLERKSSCDFCRLVSKSGGIKNEEAHEKKDVTLSNVCSDEELANPGMRKVNTDSIVTTREKGRFSMTVGAQVISVFLPLRRRRVEIHRLESRSVNGQGRENDNILDFQTAKLWFQQEDKIDTTYIEAFTDTSNNFRFIGVKQQCSVKAKKAQRYIALSYVLGVVEKELEGKKSTLAALGKKGSLHSHDPSLSQTTRDALLLMSQIEERCLWIGLLCIVQDDEGARADQIASMDQINRNPYAKIIARYGKDANAGLPGLRAGTKRWPQYREHLQGV